MKMGKKTGEQTFQFANPRVIIATGTVGVPFEGQGPLAEEFDLVLGDLHNGENSFERVETFHAGPGLPPGAGSCQPWQCGSRPFSSSATFFKHRSSPSSFTSEVTLSPSPIWEFTAPAPPW